MKKYKQITAQERDQTVIDTKIEHKWKNYPDFGHLHYENKGGREVLTIKGEQTSISIENSPTEFSFRVEQPAKMKLDKDWPDNTQNQADAYMDGRLVFIHKTEKDLTQGWKLYADSQGQPLEIQAIQFIHPENTEDKGYNPAKGYDDLKDPNIATDYILRLVKCGNTFHALNPHVLRQPLGGEPFDPEKHNINVEGLTLFNKTLLFIDRSLDGVRRDAIDKNGDPRFW